MRELWIDTHMSRQPGGPADRRSRGAMTTYIHIVMAHDHIHQKRGPQSTAPTLSLPVPPLLSSLPSAGSLRHPPPDGRSVGNSCRHRLSFFLSVTEPEITEIPSQSKQELTADHRDVYVTHHDGLPGRERERERDKKERNPEKNTAPLSKESR